jgi:hypothetical protein
VFLGFLVSGCGSGSVTLWFCGARYGSGMIVLWLLVVEGVSMFVVGFGDSQVVVCGGKRGDRCWFGGGGEWDVSGVPSHSGWGKGLYILII